MLYIMCGPPGSGKTTYSQQLAQQLNAKLYCYDDIPQSSNPKKFEMLHKQMWSDILQDLQQGFDVVCDDLHTTLKQRSDILRALKSVECKKVLIVMTTPIWLCLERNQNRPNHLPDMVITSIHKTFEQPTLEEGWDEIIFK